jgi:hypothetical protein
MTTHLPKQQFLFGAADLPACARLYCFNGGLLEITCPAKL